MKSRIEWTEYSWNPVTGCTKISPGCAHCYAERFATRLQSMGNRRYQQGFGVRVHNDLLTVPLRWKKPRVIFVNSMSDLFHGRVPADFIKKVFGTMNRCPQHTFQILTKRSRRLLELSFELKWTHNIWMGVSVENADMMHRIEDLVLTNAKVKFVSCEPLLGPLDLRPIRGIDWIIVGGESGPNARPMCKEWVLSIRDQCNESDVPYFFKQWGGTNKKASGRLLDGQTWDQRPPLAHEILQDRQLRLLET